MSVIKSFRGSGVRKWWQIQISRRKVLNKFKFGRKLACCFAKEQLNRKKNTFTFLFALVIETFPDWLKPPYLCTISSNSMCSIQVFFIALHMHALFQLWRYPYILYWLHQIIVWTLESCRHLICCCSRIMNVHINLPVIACVTTSWCYDL